MAAPHSQVFQSNQICLVSNQICDSGPKTPQTPSNGQTGPNPQTVARPDPSDHQANLVIQSEAEAGRCLSDRLRTPIQYLDACR